MNRFRSLRCLKKFLDEIIKFIMPRFSKLYESTQKKSLKFLDMILLKLEAKLDYDSSLPFIFLQISTQLNRNQRHKGDYCNF